MSKKKQKPHFVQLELFPEYALPQGGGESVSEKKPRGRKAKGDNK